MLDRSTEGRRRDLRRRLARPAGDGMRKAIAHPRGSANRRCASAQCALPDKSMARGTHEPRAGNRQIKKDWAENPRWKGVQRGYTAEDVYRLRGSGADRAHAGPARRREAVEAAARSSRSSTALGALTGNQAMQQVKAGLKAIYLSGWQVAADANDAVEMYPDQSLYPVTACRPWCADQQRLHARRPDPPCRRQGRHRLVRADRRRRRSRLRRRAQRL